MNRFQNHFLTFARLFWLAFLLFKWVYWIASMPRFFALVNAGAIPTVITSGVVQVSPDIFAADAATWGISVPAWAVLNTLVNVLSATVFSLTAALVWWRLRTWFGWLTAMVLLVGGSNVQSNVVHTAMISPVAQTIWEAGALIWPFFFLWLYLFPMAALCRADCAGRSALCWQCSSTFRRFSLPWRAHGSPCDC